MDCSSYKNTPSNSEDINQILARIEKDGDCKHFILIGRKDLILIRSWPLKLIQINLRHCGSLQTLPATWPENLTYLNISECSSLKIMPSVWSVGLTQLDLSGCSSLQALDAQWPEGLIQLDLSGCSSLQALDAQWPEGLMQLYLSRCSNLQVVPLKWPSKLMKLNLTGCSNLHDLPSQWPTELTHLNISGCSSLKMIRAAWPVKLIHLNVSKCSSLEALDAQWPEGLTDLDVSRCSSLKVIRAAWPTKLRDLNLSGCTRLEKLTLLWPTELIDLNLSECSLLEKLPPWPSESKLKKLNLSKCSSLQTLSLTWPAELTDLNLSRCSSLKEVSSWPPELKVLDITGCSTLQALPATWPSGLFSQMPSLASGQMHLDLSGCSSLQQLPPWPEEWVLIQLTLSCCSSLESVPHPLPKALINLYLNGCTALTEVPPLPTNLKNLDLRQCFNLQTLPALPAGLRYLNLIGCDRLDFTPELILRLQTLKNSGCAIYYPEVASLDTQANLLTCRLGVAISSAGLTPIPHHIRHLMLRFISENKSERGEELVLALDPLISFFEKYPENLTWANVIASVFIEGCVNQPVRGWSEIASWAQITLSKTLLEKLDAARYLLTLEDVARIVKMIPPGKKVEVEAANTLLREVHSTLLASQRLSEPWMCVPQGIAYQKTVESWIERANVKDAKEDLEKKIFALTPEEIAQRLCNTHFCILWGTLAFPKEVAALKERYKILKEDSLSLIELSRNPQNRAAILADLPTEQRRRQFEAREKEMKGKSTALIYEYIANLENKENNELTETITELTHSTLLSEQRSQDRSRFWKWLKVCT